ncbi:TonB-dependent receptor [bacterium]|nr:TonB-dependent receptor [bacterium]
MIAVLIVMFLVGFGFLCQDVQCQENDIPEEVAVTSGADDRVSSPENEEDPGTHECPRIFVQIERMHFTFNTSFLERLPETDRMLGGFCLAPGVLNEGGLLINGAGPVENKYSLEGFELTNPNTSLFSSRLIFDAFDHLSVQTGAFGDGRGKAQGGLVDFGLKRGDDQFHGGIRSSYASSALSSPAGPGRPEVESSEFYRQSIWINGPIEPEKSWLALAYEYEYEHLPRELAYAWSPESGDYSYTSVEADRLYQTLTAALTAHTDKHEFLFLFLGSDGVRHNQADSQYTPDAQAKLFQQEYLFGMNWSSTYTEAVSNTTSVHFHSLANRILPEHSSNEHPVWDSKVMLWFHNLKEKEKEKLDRFSVSSQTTIEHMLGSNRNEIVIDLSYNRLKSSRETESTTGKYYETDWFGTDGQQPRNRWEAVFDFRPEIKAEQIGASITDHFQPTGNLQVDIGLSYDYTIYINEWYIRNYIFNDTWGPYLGFEWLVDPARDLTLFGTYNRTYTPYDLSLVYSLCSVHYAWYRYDPDHPYADDEGYYRMYQSDGDYTHYLFDRDTKAEYTDEIVLGGQIPLRNHALSGLNLIYRHTDNIIEDVIYFLDENGEYHRSIDVDPDNQDEVGAWYDEVDAYPEYLITNPPGAYRDYYGLQLYQTYQGLRNTVMFSYTFSQTRGTQWKSLYDGHQDYLDHQMHWESAYDTPYLTQNIDGRLPYDSPHVIKIVSASQLPLGFTFGSSLLYRSGYTYNRRGARLPGPDGVLGTNDDLDLTDPIYGQGVRFVNQRGSYRLPNVFVADISLQRDFPLGHFGIVTAIIDIINLFDNQVVLERTELDGPDFGTATRWNSPRTVTFQLKFAF